MNKKVIYIGLGAVVAYLLYKKFVAKSDTKSTEAEVVEEAAAEEAPAGGGGGGAAAAAPVESAAATKTEITNISTTKPNKSTPAPVVKKQTASLKPMMVKGSKGKPMVSTAIAMPTKGNATGLRPAFKKGVVVRPLASKPMAKFAGYMDFDANDDVLGDLM
jgi:hypothetical protein